MRIIQSTNSDHHRRFTLTNYHHVTLFDKEWTKSSISPHFMSMWNFVVTTGYDEGMKGFIEQFIGKQSLLQGCEFLGNLIFSPFPLIMDLVYRNGQEFLLFSENGKIWHFYKSNEKGPSLVAFKMCHFQSWPFAYQGDNGPCDSEILVICSSLLSF